MLTPTRNPDQWSISTPGLRGDFQVVKARGKPIRATLVIITDRDILPEEAAAMAVGAATEARVDLVPRHGGTGWKAGSETRTCTITLY